MENLQIFLWERSNIEYEIALMFMSIVSTQQGYDVRCQAEITLDSLKEQDTMSNAKI